MALDSTVRNSPRSGVMFESNTLLAGDWLWSVWELREAELAHQELTRVSSVPMFADTSGGLYKEPGSLCEATHCRAARRLSLSQGALRWRRQDPRWHRWVPQNKEQGWITTGHHLSVVKLFRRYWEEDKGSIPTRGGKGVAFVFPNWCMCAPPPAQWEGVLPLTSFAPCQESHWKLQAQPRRNLLSLFNLLTLRRQGISRLSCQARNLPSLPRLPAAVRGQC